MKKELTYTFGILILLTIVTIIVFNLPIVKLAKTALILVFFSAKFLLVAFQFMDLKKANIFWKSSVICILILINAILIVS